MKLINSDQKIEGEKSGSSHDCCLDLGNGTIAVPSSRESILVPDASVGHLDARAVRACVEVLLITIEAVLDASAAHVRAVAGALGIRASLA